MFAATVEHSLGSLLHLCDADAFRRIVRLALPRRDKRLAHGDLPVWFGDRYISDTLIMFGIRGRRWPEANESAVSTFRDPLGIGSHGVTAFSVVAVESTIQFVGPF